MAGDSILFVQTCVAYLLTRTAFCFIVAIEIQVGDCAETGKISRTESARKIRARPDERSQSWRAVDCQSLASLQSRIMDAPAPAG